eukprot:3660634-Karenia_brevis.AAC.1
MGIAILSPFAHILGHDPLFDPVSATEDMKSAYRQIALEDGRTRFSVNAVWHVHKRCWQFAELATFAFGLFNSAMRFNT